MLSPVSDIFYKSPPFGITLITGMAGTGKTTLVKRLAKNAAKQGNFHRIIVICPNLKNNEYDFLSNDYVITRFDEKILENIIEQQQEYNTKGKKLHTLLILDGCDGFINFNSTLWKRICYIHKFKLTLLLVLKDVSRTTIPSFLKERLDVMFCTKPKPNNLAAIARMRGNRGKQRFITWLEKATNNWGAVRIELSTDPYSQIMLKQPNIGKSDNFHITYEKSAL
jgi:hypothetical protein